MFKRFVFTIMLVLCLGLADANAIERQRGINWCWAACVQDVMRQANIYLSQVEIATRLSGWPQDRPAYTQEVAMLLRSYNIRARQAGAPGTPQQLYGTLTSGYKIIAFVRPTNSNIGHFIVLQGIDPRSGGIIVSDPATGATFLNSIQQLYFGWRWGDSVIVG